MTALANYTINCEANILDVISLDIASTRVVNEKLVIVAKPTMVHNDNDFDKYLKDHLTAAEALYVIKMRVKDNMANFFFSGTAEYEGEQYECIFHICSQPTDQSQITAGKGNAWDLTAEAFAKDTAAGWTISPLGGFIHLDRGIMWTNNDWLVYSEQITRCLIRVLDNYKPEKRVVNWAVTYCLPVVDDIADTIFPDTRELAAGRKQGRKMVDRAKQMGGDRLQKPIDYIDLETKVTEESKEEA